MAEDNETPEETPEVVETAAEAEAHAVDTAEEAAPEPAVPAQPVEVLTPKERRQRARARRAAKAPARSATTPEERQAERDSDRARKAQLRSAERTRARAKAKAAGPTAAAATPPRERGPGRQKTRQGVVVSDKADKTITVRIDVARPHRRYQKIVRTSSTLHAHDEANDAHIGDKVVVRECRPLSRSKHWRLIEVLERAK